MPFCGLFVVVRAVLDDHGQAVVVHRQGLELEATGPVHPVDLLPDGLVRADAPADILVDGVIGKAQIVLVGEARQTVGGGLDEEPLPAGPAPGPER